MEPWSGTVTRAVNQKGELSIKDIGLHYNNQEGEKAAAKLWYVFGHVCVSTDITTFMYKYKIWSNDCVISVGQLPPICDGKQFFSSSRLLWILIFVEILLRPRYVIITLNSIKQLPWSPALLCARNEHATCPYLRYIPDIPSDIPAVYWNFVYKVSHMGFVDHMFQ